MAIPEKNISDQLLSQLPGSSNKEKWEQLAKDHPWYPLPWLMLADNTTHIQKASLWFKNEHRIHWLLNKDEISGDTWLESRLKALSTSEEAKFTPTEPNIAATAKIPNEEKIDVSAENAPEEIAQQPIEEADNQKIEENKKLLTAENELIEEEEEDSDVAEMAALPKETEAPIYVATPAAPAEEDVTEEQPVLTPETAAAAKAEDQEATGKKSNKGASMLFEPLFATDYFASQGIKVDPNAIPKTKLDLQVKTFTQWLKSMKRIAPETNLPADPLVDAQANASVEEKDVVTEAMVAVLEKQGKYQKAVEILAKLILLHPEKSAFFAAQIENLKAKQ